MTDTTHRFRTGDRLTLNATVVEVAAQSDFIRVEVDGSPIAIDWRSYDTVIASREPAQTS